MLSKQTAISLTILACGLLLTGCQPLREVRTYPLQNSIHLTPAGRIAPGLQQLEHKLTAHVDSFDYHQSHLQERITYLENELLNISGIDTINVVIIENAAIISVSLQDNVSKAGISYLRDTIAQQTKRLDDDIRYVTVTVSPELAGFLDELSEPLSRDLTHVPNERDTLSNYRPVS